jgi:outer membrane protein with beta-barrel domain
VRGFARPNRPRQAAPRGVAIHFSREKEVAVRWKTAILGLVLAGSLVASSAHALGGIVFGAQGGTGLPTSDYGDSFKSGYNFGGTVDFMLMPMFGLGADLAYYDNKAKDELSKEFSDSLSAVAGSPVSGEVKTDALQYGVHATFMPPVPGGFSPYLQAGIAQYNTKLKFDGGGASIDMGKSNKMGFNFGGGAGFHIAPLIGVGLDAHYHFVGTKDDYDADLSWLAISARLTVKLPMP